MPMRRAMIHLAVLCCALAACSGGGAGDTSTTGGGGTSPATTTGVTTTAAGATTTAAVPTTTPSPASTTTSVDPSSLIPDYQIEARLASDAGDTVVVSLEPATYSDLDIENVVNDVLQRFAPILTVHVVDDAGIADLVLADEATLTEEQIASRDAHYYARLEEGFRLVFEGPFDSIPTVILGS